MRTTLEKIYKEYVASHRRKRFQAIRELPKSEQVTAIQKYKKNINFCRMMDNSTELTNDIS